MSLIKLLTVSRSFVAGQIPTGRYRMVGRQGGLPQFGPTADPSHLPGVHAPPRLSVASQGEFARLVLPESAPALLPGTPAPADAASDGGLAGAGAQPESVPTVARCVTVPPGGCALRLGPDHPRRSVEPVPTVPTVPAEPLPVPGKPSDPAPATRAASSSPFAPSRTGQRGLGGEMPRRSGVVRRAVRGLKNWLRPKPGRNSKSPFVGKPVRSPVQAHLKLEAVQVIRNDLSDSDYEVRQAGLAAGVAMPHPRRAKPGLLAASWSQVTARWLDTTRARAQVR